jgi:two-component system, NarL family, nitrate/nitrite response regulator NarL
MSDTKAPIRIVIADDHPLVRDGLRKLFELQPGFTVVGEAGDGLDAVRQVKELTPDLLLLDLTMPRMNGLEVLKELADSATDVRTVLLTAAIEREETVHAIRLGARGVVLKEAATQMLYKCIHAVMNGEYWVGHERIGDLMQSLLEHGRGQARGAHPASTLTRRELQVVAAVVDGTNNREIGESLSITEQTVKNHLSNIFDKLGVSNRLELALYAVHRRLLAGDTSGGGGIAGRAPEAAGQRVGRAK